MKKRGLSKFLLIVYCVFLLSPVTIFGQTGDWNTITNTGIIHRHECSFIELNGKFYLVGGRKLGVDKYTNIYNPATGAWTTSSQKSPIELHHFQAVAWNNKIYVIGAFTGNFPDETPTDRIYIYDPVTDTWAEGGTIPVARRRGASGSVVYNNKIYIVGGATNGHEGGNVAWLDEYDPATDTWNVLPDAPHTRDHFQAAIKGSKLFLAGGRNTSYSTGHLNDLVVTEVDVFDFSTNAWETYPNNLPTGRAGTAAVVLNNELIVMGGEGPNSASLAHKETEALDIDTRTWRTLAPLDTGRHATHALVFNNNIFIAAGCKTKGGSSSSELSSMEEFSFATSNPDELSFPAEVVFGQVNENESDTKTVTLLNDSGNQDITIQNISFDNNMENAFSLNNGPFLPYILSAGSSITFNVIFEPTSSGEKTANLIVDHNGGNSPSSIFLKGEGVFNVTGINNKYFTTVSIYPNPTRKELTIENLSEGYEWEIDNLSGVKLLNGRVTSQSLVQNIDLSRLTAGMYVLILKNDNHHKSFLIKKE